MEEGKLIGGVYKYQKLIKHKLWEIRRGFKSYVKYIMTSFLTAAPSVMLKSCPTHFFIAFSQSSHDNFSPHLQSVSPIKFIASLFFRVYIFTPQVSP
jgi:hypothetical protein